MTRQRLGDTRNAETPAKSVQLQNQAVYGSNRKWMVIVTCAGTGWPFRVAGSYRYSFKEATAGDRSEGGPESMLTRFTSPAVPTTASTTTFPVSKSRRASMGARARTDLISLGGTMPLSPAAAAMESEVAFAAGRTAEGFDAKPDKGGVFFPAGCTLELFSASE
jgi:hypothetical protein